MALHHVPFTVASCIAPAAAARKPVFALYCGCLVRLEQTENIARPMTQASEPNWPPRTIWTGDNLPVMRGMNTGCVDLIYLDPPFNSNADYAAAAGSPAEGAAFKDVWSLADVDVEWVDLIEAKHPRLLRVLLAAATGSDKSYLVYMAVRLLEMRRILKASGSIYLHCDPTMSHYLKLVMDAIFGRGNFCNELVWCYHKWTNASKSFQKNHDIILFYRKGAKGSNVFNKQFSRFNQAHTRKGFHTNTIDGKRQLLIYDHDKARRIDQSKYDIVTDRSGQAAGKAVGDWWADISILNSQARERTGFKTQKPLALLERIVAASSSEGDMVLDPFCGCATSLVAAEHLGRQWGGIDISARAAELAVQRMEKQQQAGRGVAVRGDIPQRTDLGRLPPPATHQSALYRQQGEHCTGCNKRFELYLLEVAYIIAASKGGTDQIENLQLLCGNCNRIKGKRGVDYLRAKLQIG